MLRSTHLLVYLMALVFAHHAMAQNQSMPQIPPADGGRAECNLGDGRDCTPPTEVAAESNDAEHNTASTPVGRCSDFHCPSSGSVEVQYGVFAECLDGPDQSVHSPCSCADLDGDDFVSLRDFAIYQVAPVFLCQRDLVIWQGSGLGFCPELGTIYRASVFRDHSGRRLLAGSMIAEGNLETDSCISPNEISLPLPCYVAVPFPVRLLTEPEWAEIAALVDGIPPEGCQPECTLPCIGRCCDALYYDTCRILHVNQDTTFCYGEGNASVYRQAIQAVAAHVAALVTDGAP